MAFTKALTILLFSVLITNATPATDLAQGIADLQQNMDNHVEGLEKGAHKLIEDGENKIQGVVLNEAAKGINPSLAPVQQLVRSDLYKSESIISKTFAQDEATIDKIVFATEQTTDSIFLSAQRDIAQAVQVGGPGGRAYILNVRDATLKSSYDTFLTAIKAVVTVAKHTSDALAYNIQQIEFDVHKVLPSVSKIVNDTLNQVKVDVENLAAKDKKEIEKIALDGAKKLVELLHTDWLLIQL